jgi:hypothetical protein
MNNLSRSPETFSFDCDAWSNLMKRTDSETHDALAMAHQLTAAGALCVLATIPLLVDLQGLRKHAPALREDAQGKLLTLACGRVLRATDERIELERQLGRRLTSSEFVYPSEVVTDILIELANNSEIRPDLDGFKHGFSVEQRLLRGAVRALFDKAEKRRLLAGWHERLHDDVVERCQEDLPSSSGAGPNHPHALAPSLWHLRSYQVTRDRLVALEAEGPSNIDPNDKVDERHYADAAYSTRLVSDDGGLRRIADRCPTPKVTVVTSQDWIRWVLSG